jgi:hypothetical protein
LATKERSSNAFPLDAGEEEGGGGGGGRKKAKEGRREGGREGGREASTSSYARPAIQRLEQRGVLRTNCIDSLDR